MNEEVQALSKRVTLRNIVKQLWWTSQSDLVVDEKVGNRCAKPVGLWDHVGVKAGKEFTRATAVGSFQRLGNTVVKIAGLEVMRLTWNLGSGTVEEVSKTVLFLGSVDRSLELSIFAIVEDPNTESVNGVVEVASGNGSVHDDIDLLLAASDQDIDGRNVGAVAEQSKSRSRSLLPDEDTPEHLEEDWDGNTDFDTDECPCHVQRLTLLVLSSQDENDAQNEVSPVSTEREDSEDRGKVVTEVLPARDAPIVILVGQSSDSVFGVDFLDTDSGSLLSLYEVF